MKRINLYQAKTHLSKLVAAVEETGETVVLCRSGRPVADIVPHQAHPGRLEPDPELQGAQFTGDPCAPVGAEDWPEGLK